MMLDICNVVRMFYQILWLRVCRTVRNWSLHGNWLLWAKKM